MRSTHFHQGLLVAAAAAAMTPAVLAQDSYPSRPITMVVPFAAGSGTDIGTRILAKDLTALLGATVIVDNKPGANGAIAAQAAARAKPDGYTLLVGSATTNAANFAFFPGKLGYEPTSFDIISGLGGSAISLYVAANSPWKTIAELVADAKRQPGKFNCGSGNAVTQVACEVFRMQAGIEAVNVPYKSNPQSLTDVVGGQVSFAFADASVAQVFLEGKRLRAIGVAASQRNPVTPDAATFKEQGFPDFEITAWTAVFAPAGTPAPIVEKLNAAIRKSADSPESVASRTRSGSFAINLDVAEARRFAANEVARWARYVKDSGVKPEQ
jgi:tripartite-type tricarboxylate transporter receptor subunit TctC